MVFSQMFLFLLISKAVLIAHRLYRVKTLPDLRQLQTCGTPLVREVQQSVLWVGFSADIHSVAQIGLKPYSTS
jgi:hypothetical protein